ncbi:MAG: phosphate ABC transporter permease subunit PstC [Actinomycetota bacterium]|nr:phosphate ABC transporter permease subunit PstC [Actinomycetota bacterium]
MAIYEAGTGAVGRAEPLSRKRTGVGRFGDELFRLGVTGAAAVVLALLALMLVRVTGAAWPLLRDAGAELLTGRRWAPAADVFGGLPFLFGTLVSSLVAIVLAVPVSLGIALFVNEVAPSRMRSPLVYLVELLAAVPSVVYGLWGLVVLLPRLERHAWAPLSGALGSIPIFSGPVYGQSFATAGVVLAIMIIPIVTAISREVIALVPSEHKEGALALGATRWEVLRLAVIPYARSGIIGGVMLGFGRAIGETIAVALVIGGNPQIVRSLFQPGYTIASVIASQFNEATGTHIQALIALGVVLFGVTVLVNVLGRLFVWRAARGLAS